MAYQRGAFGIEYNPPPTEPGVPLTWKIVGGIFILTLVSLAWTIRARLETAAETEEIRVATSTPRAAETNRTSAAVAPPAPPAIVSGTSRPPRLRNLLQRLEVAQKTGDLEMEISTIEQIRELPGGPAADLDNALAQRLGQLNVRRLFVNKSPKWTIEVTVTRGSNATRIAREQGATLASLEKLNGDVNRLRAGQKLTVLNHPRFSLVVYRVTKTADLSLNGKFFKRYYLAAPVSGAVGTYATPERLRPFWSEKGIALAAEDRAELEMLLPANTPVIISEFK